MRIGKLESPKISFKRALTSAEEVEYSNALTQTKNTVNKGGKSILIVHDSCLPQNALTDTGIGHLTSKTSGDFFDFAKTYLGINTVEVLPPGEIQIKHTKDFYNTYNGSGLSLGTQNIDLELLTKPEFNSILPRKEFEKVVKANKSTQIAGFVNYENIIGADSPQEKALKIAFENFKKDKSIDKRAYEQFKNANKDWLEPKSIYPTLKRLNKGTTWEDWTNKIDKTLLDGKTPKHVKRLAEIKKKYAKEIEFYKFKQYIADAHLRAGKKSLNDKGMKLFGDCLLGFSDDETWAFKKAFKQGVFVGDSSWRIPALDYDTILEPNSDAQKLLTQKVGLFAKRYDGIRMDASWNYVKPKLSDGSVYDDLKGNLLNIIERAVKTSNKDFDMSNLIHEFEAAPKDFSIFTNDKQIIPFLKKRVQVISSAHLSDEYGTSAIMKKVGALPDEYIIGVGNHDPQPLRQIAENVPEILNGKKSYRRFTQQRVLQKILGIEPEAIRTPADFAKAKFAEPLMSKNQMVFYMDVFGRAERFDSQMANCWKNYRYRIADTFLEDYHQAVKSGFGYSPMDAFAKVFEAKGLDKTQESLYRKILKFRDILADKTETVSKTITEKTSDLSKNRLLNIGGAVLALGLIATVVALTNKGLDKQTGSKKINTNS